MLNSDTCAQCAAGTFQDQPGQSEDCKECEEGKTSNAGAAACETPGSDDSTGGGGGGGGGNTGAIIGGVVGGVVVVGVAIFLSTQYAGVGAGIGSRLGKGKDTRGYAYVRIGNLYF